MAARSVVILSVVAISIAASTAFAFWARAAHKQESIEAIGGTKVRVTKDIYYGFPGLKETSLDLYCPVTAQGEHVPVVVWIHGGAWMSGNKEYPPYTFFVKNGMALASINYRFSTKEKFPAQIEDCKQAIRWLRKNGWEYGLDTSRIGAFGISAGGHLAALLGTASDVTALDAKGGAGDISPRVQAVADWSGPSNFSTIEKQAKAIGSQIDYVSERSPIKLLLGGRVSEKPREAYEASPIAYATPDDPPFFIMHGDRDDVVPVAQSDELKQALTKAGCKVRYEIEPGGGHMIATPANLPKAVHFFQETLQHKSLR